MGQLTRRAALAMGAGALVGPTSYLSAERAATSRDTPYITSPRPTASEYTLDIMVHTTPTLHPKYARSSFTELDLLVEAIEYALSSLSEPDFRLIPNVSIAPSPAPLQFNWVEDYSALTDKFADYIVDEVEDESSGDDANLLLTPATNEDRRGHGHLPGSIYTDGCQPMQAVMGGGRDIDPGKRDAATSLRTGSIGARLNTAVHEIGHTIGLEHTMGNAWRDPNDNQRIIVTPMLSTYVLADDDGDNVTGTNRYGTELPEVSRDDDAYLVYTPRFNPEISISDLIVGEEFDAGCWLAEKAQILVED